MPKFQNITGQRFGRLVVVERQPRTTRRDGVRWVCLCDCGRTMVTLGKRLKTGHTRSCGCLLREMKTTHGMAWTPTWRSWVSMKSRCGDPNSTSYKNYGGRGINVCDQWLSFEKFIADMGERPDGRSLDRVNNDGNYEPGNCRWATASQQRRNQSRRRDSRDSSDDAS